VRLDPWNARFQFWRIAVAGLIAVTAFDLAACHQTSRKPTQAFAAPPAPGPPPPPPPFTPKDVSISLETLRHAPDQGFSAKRFGVEQIERLIGSGTGADRPAGDRLLRSAVLNYARAQHGLTIPQAALPKEWNQRPSTYDAEAELNAALRNGDLQSWLDGLSPQTATYRALQAAYVAAMSEPAPRARPRVEPSPLELHEQDAGAKALRRRMALEDPKLADVAVDAPVDQDLIDALKAYQARHGLDQTGILDAATAQQLNTPVLSKAARLRANLERLRWLPRPEPPRRIDVNIAGSTMVYIQNDDVSVHMLSVSGKLGDETPIVSSAIDSIVLDPPWYVPSDIARREIVPKGAIYMAARHFVWRGGRLIQLPGPKTALGLVKFDFPNPYAVYLHDTPSKAAFNLAQRTASHGCVRLQHAVELARVLVAQEPGSSAERVDRILASGKTVRVTLKRPVPLRLMYLTAEPRDGTIVYLPDVYGWDARLLALLDRYEQPRRSKPSR
jgi:murein L,D-transpeptidase YcbB/YkuD